MLLGDACLKSFFAGALGDDEDGVLSGGLLEILGGEVVVVGMGDEDEVGIVFFFRQLEPLVGFSLGFNLFNAAVVGVLGFPGFLLLLALQWLL